MRLKIATCLLLVVAVGCSSKNNTSGTDGTSFTLSGTVESVSPGDKPSTTPKGITGIAGSLTLKADTAVSGCDNPTKVFFTASTRGSGTGTLNGKRVDLTGTQYSGCTLVADSISTAAAASAGSSGTGTSTSGSPGPLPSGSPKVTKGPAPEGAIYDQTPSVPPASQK